MGLLGEVFANAGLHVDSASFAQYASELQAAEGQISDFSSGSQTILAGAFTMPAAAIAGVAAYGVNIASGFEDAGTTLTTLYGSADIAREKFQWLSDFAATTPFEFPELLDATVKLKAYGIEAEDYMRVIGDTAAGMGKRVGDVVEAIADAQTGEFERMKEFGIKAAEITNKNYQAMGANIEQVGQTGLMYTDKYGKQQLAIIDRNNREMITSTITAIWNDKYKGAMEARSKTLTGLLSTLKDNISFGLADMVGFDMKTMEIQTASIMGVFKELVAITVDVTGSFAGMGESVQTFIVVAAVGAAGIGLLAAGFLAYGMILPLLTADTAIFGVTLSAAIWPVTAVVGGLALLAAGLVYLDEKTGLVSTAWQIFSDTVTIVWAGLKLIVSGITGTFEDMYDTLMGMFGEGALVGMFDSLLGGLEKIGGFLSGIIEGWHQLAEGVRGETDETKTAISEVGAATQETEAVTETSTGGMAGAWDTLKSAVVGGNNEMAESSQTAAKKTEDAWTKAFAKMQETATNVKVADINGVENNTPELSNKLTSGIQGNGELLGINSNGELVIQTLEGVTTKLNELNSTQDLVFKGIDKNYAIIIDDGSRTREELDQQAIGFREMGNEVIVVKQNVDALNGASMSELSNQMMGLSKNATDGNYSVSLLNGSFQITNSLPLTNVNGQVQAVGTSVDGTKAKDDTLNSTLNATNLIPMSTLLNQVNTTGTAIDTTKGKDDVLNSTLNTTNNSPFGTIFGNLNNTGILVDSDSGRTTNLNTTLGSTNNSPFGTLFGNLNTAGSLVDSDSGRTINLNNTFANTNSTPFGTLFGNLGNTGSLIDTNTGKTITGNSNLGTMGGFSFSTTLSSLGGVGSAIDYVITKAQDAISWLSKLGKASSSASSSTSSSSGTGESGVKVVSTVYKNTINNLGDKISIIKAKAAGV